jgi:hypothetical protein
LGIRAAHEQELEPGELILLAAGDHGADDATEQHVSSLASDEKSGAQA